MVSEATVLTLYAFAAFSAALLGYVVWQHREKPGALPLLGSVLGGGWWATGLFVLTLGPTYAVAEPLLRSLPVASSVITFSIALFALEYTGREDRITKRTIGLLAVHPVAIAALAFLDPNDLIFASLSPDPSLVIGVDIEWGVGALLHLVYSYVVLFFVTALIVEMLLRSRGLYHGQVAVLVLALLAPVLPNLLHFYGPVDFDITPLGFLAANGLFAIAITRYHFIDIAPIARDRVLENVSDAVYVVDTAGRIVDANEASRGISDDLVGETDLVGRAAEDVLGQVSEGLEAYREIVDAGTERSVELSVAGRHYDVDASPIDDGRGRHVGWLFLVRDVTDRKRREAELRRRNEQLDQFASVVSHDLRNPLGVAKGYAQAAKETEDVTHLREVERAHDRMERIIEDVLALAREGEDVADPSVVDLGDVAEDAWSNVETAGASLRVIDAGDLLADRDRLARMLENLFRNAVEHGSTSPRSDTREDAVEHGSTSPRSDTREDTAGRESAPGGVGVELTVEVGSLVDGTGFYVADDGSGIPDEDRSKVFESSYSGSDDGTGFGLDIVERIAAAHGWTVSVAESESGGARFEVTGVKQPDG